MAQIITSITGGFTMKRLLLAASLCIAVFVVAPIASASAQTLTGTCAVSGTATFEHPLQLAASESNHYEFAGQATCVGTNGVSLSGHAFVQGNFEGSCLTGAGKEEHDNGVLTGIEGGPYEFSMGFTSVAGDVVLTIDGGLPNGAIGDAEFLTSNPVLPEGQLAAECAAGDIRKLGFVAAAAGTI
jgi:hypothetical protein